MKAFKLVLLAVILSFSFNTKAQVSVNVNIGTPPVWGPVGYPDCHYYYLPDIHAYYDVRAEMFICQGRRGWYHTRVLPGIYANFDLYNGCKVVLDFRGDNPYRYYDTHCVKYPKGYKTHYKHHKKHHGHHGHDNGHHYGEYKHGHSKYRKVNYVEGHSHGRREYDDHHEERRGGHGHDNGHGRRG